MVVLVVGIGGIESHFSWFYLLFGVWKKLKICLSTHETIPALVGLAKGEQLWATEKTQL